MPERNSISKSARSVLLEDFNDIDVYVEDTSIETNKLYTTILNKATNNKYKLSNVIPLGNSKTVIDEWKKHRHISDARKKIFIIDGDFYIINNNIFDIINDPSVKDLRGLFILPKYCIENYLLQEDSVLTIIDEEEPEKNLETIKNTLNFSKWRNDNEENLIELFIIYSIIIHFKLGIPNVQYKVTKLCKDNSGVVCSQKINDRIAILKNEIKKHPHINLDEEINLRKEKINKNMDKFFTYISAKDYLLPLLKTRIKSDNKFNTENTSFKIRLAKKGSFETLKSIYDSAL